MKRFLLSLLSLLPLLMVGCYESEEPVGPEVPIVGSLTLSQEQLNVGAEGGDYSVDIYTEYAYQASANVNWIEFSGGSCSPEYCTQYFTVKANNTTSSREGVITVFCDDYNLSATLTIEQEGFVEPEEPEQPEEPEVPEEPENPEITDSAYNRKWAEQPEKKDIQHYIHKTYYSTLMDGKRVRNFSVCYDTEKMCSRWVAYPGHSVYRKWGSYQVGENNNSGRTNAWAFDDAVTEYAPSTDYNCAYSIVSKYDSKTDAYDTAKEPIIPHSRQADICFTNGFGWGWARGHMLPSSQRYNTWENNAQTCYATNIMVQQYDFNGGAWADVEALERNKNCSDTLYVVVGTLFEDNKTISRFGRTIGVPTHCYKLLLRTKSGSSRKAISDITSADELICIGFLFENSESSKDATMASAAVSVAEIEKRAGFKFFRNLNPAIADKVKSQNRPSDWGI